MHLGNDPNLNRTGIGIMPNGWLNQNSGNREYLNQRSYIWTSEINNNNSWTVYYRYDISSLGEFNHPKKSGLPVRLIRDYTSEGNSDIGSVLNDSYPLHNNLNPYTYSQSLYPVGVLGDLKSINKITWITDTDINLYQTNDQWEIYLAETDSNSLESGGWISPSEFTTVFHGDVRCSTEYYGVGTGQHN